LKFSNWKNSGKKYNEALRNQLAEYHLTRQKRCAKDSPAESGLNDRLKKTALHEPLQPSEERRSHIYIEAIDKPTFKGHSIVTNFRSCFYQRRDKTSVKECMLSTAIHCTLRSRKLQLYEDIKSRYL